MARMPRVAACTRSIVSAVGRRSGTVILRLYLGPGRNGLVWANTTPRHVPAKILQVADIPRTKSGKIVELAVRNVVHGLPVKNIEALANAEALEHFRGRTELAG